MSGKGISKNAYMSYNTTKTFEDLARLDLKLYQVGKGDSAMGATVTEICKFVKLRLLLITAARLEYMTNCVVFIFR